MSKNYLNLYGTEGDFGATLNDKDNRKPNVSYVEGGKVHINETMFFTPDDAKAGDIAMSDGTNRFCVTQQNYKILKEQGKIGNGLTPIGVCAVPKALADKDTGTNKGKSRFISLANMDCKNPTTGSIIPGATTDGTSMYWGDNTRTLGTVNNGGANCFNPKTGAKTTTTWGYLPTNCGMSGEKNPVLSEEDPGTRYYFTADHFSKNTVDADNKAVGTDGHCLYSPYGTDGKYFQGFLADLHGKENTDTIIGTVTATWSGATITNSYAAGHAPAACCCRRYAPTGTTAGEWYLPACGELGIMWARLKEINEGLYLVGPGLAIPVGTHTEYYSIRGGNSWAVFGRWLWSSTENSATYARYQGCYYGSSSTTTKSLLDSGNSRVRAFLAL